MKLTTTALLLLITCNVCAQRLTGLLMGDVTRMPLAYAKVTSGTTETLSGPDGIFTLKGIRFTDSIRITCAGYEYHAFKPASVNRKDTLVIYLLPIAYALKEVNIKAKRDARADSLRLRKEFASVFAYRAPKLTDALINKHYDILKYNDFITSYNNTSDIVGFNVLSVISMLSKKKEATSHLQQILLKEEANNYQAQVFSRDKVIELTGLKGDSLQTFMDKYRPTWSQLHKMSQYELIAYIKKSYSEFSGDKKVQQN
jgi:hypothetical protein